MNFNSHQFFNKANIALEYYKDTPLFIYLAHSKYEKGLYSEVVEMLEDYLGSHFNHIPSLMLLSKAYAQLGKFQLAVQTLKEASKVIRSTKSFDFYLKEIKEIQSKESIIFDSGTSHETEFRISEDFHEKEIRQIEEAKSFENMLVSETLAEIYISQGEIKEAIKIYRKLIDRKPENKKKYLDLIDELNTRLKT